MASRELRARGLWFGLARVEGAISDRWELAGAIDAVGRDRIFPPVATAIQAAPQAPA